MDLVTALTRARGTEPPGPDTPAGPPVPDWPGPGRALLPPAGPGPLDLDGLLRLSLAAADPTGRLRPTPSAGALHPVDATLLVGDGCSLPPGRYGYDPLRHRVHPLSPAPPGTAPGATVELTVTPQRTTSHYGHRAWPLLLLDTGHAVAALHLAALALASRPAALRLDGATDRPQASLHIPPPATGATTPPGPETATASDLLSRRSAAPPLTGTPDPDDLYDLLALARTAGNGHLNWCAAVGGPAPALLEAGADGTLRRLAAGDARPALAAWAAGQGWIAHAGALLLAYGCPSDADARRIRRDHLHAGYAVGRAQTAAVRRGLAARAVGSWQRADLGAALGGAPERNWIVHALALGTGSADRPEKGNS
ncbi:SagB/ThcOx family dehydrogenase [Streptomyces sp. NPDC007863]|uniref:nitroreductase family protein n=1 Tax=Streptomyces sp. NPDC007863 TaxID=3154894 RepID=UPI0034089D37